VKLLFVHRKPRKYGNFSIESYFESLSLKLNNEISIDNWYAPYFSNGFLPRVLSLLALRKYVLKSKPDITHVTGDTHFFIFGLKKTKRVLTIHDVGFLKNKTGFIFRILRYFWLTGPIKRADVVTCVSEATKIEIQNYFPFKKDIQVIPTTIDERFIPSAKSFNHELPTILLIGSAPNKNLRRVLTATKGLKVKLSIVAKLDSELKLILEDQNFELFESVSFEKLVALYRASDIVALCSTHEGFGMPIVEAQAIGRVVLTSNCSSMPEVAGNGALLVDPYSVESIREGIERLCKGQNLREQLISAGFENCRRFNSKLVADKYLELYKDLLYIK
jgi:glycosyltransferase involved in cell wall biosynthesis